MATATKSKKKSLDLVIPDTGRLHPWKAQNYLIGQIHLGHLTPDAHGVYRLGALRFREADLQDWQRSPVLRNLRVPVIHPVLQEQARKAFEAGDAMGVFCKCESSGYWPHLFVSNLDSLKARGMYESAFYYIITGPNLGAALTTDYQRYLLEQADRDKLRACGDPLPGPGPFTIYRGIAAGRRKRGLSWTDSLAVATWFARRLDRDNPTVYRTTVEIDDIVFYSNDRKEQEFYVLLPHKAKLVAVDPATQADIDAWHVAKKEQVAA